MSLFQALVYFAREAFLNLVRSWKVSLLAVLTITVSLFLTGIFLLVSGNLRDVIGGWRDESKIIVYLEADREEAARQDLEALVERPSWVLSSEEVSGEAAKERFREAFPSMVDLLEGWEDDPLPASIEIRLDWQRLSPPELDGWLEELGAHPATAMVDDDRDWLQQLEAVVLVLEGFALLVGGVLLITAIFTISSIIRLTAYLYRDEIAVMRMVGATEFFIRGPFYVEGLFQGLAGGLLSTFGLFLAFRSLHQESASLLTNVLAQEFLTPGQLVMLVGLGGLAGLVGAITSLRREALGPAVGEQEWAGEEESAQ